VIYDYCVIGGGIVGMATAMKLLEMRPGASVAVLEKEDRLGYHQTGHNSGVIHAGIYYEPGSLKAELCRRGAEATKTFCLEHGIAFEVCGKLLVATTPLEVQRMDALVDRAKLNNIEADRLDSAELKQREPNIRGLGALFVKTTGTVDFGAVTRAMGASFRAAGGDLEFNVAVTGIKESVSHVTITAGDRSWTRHCHSWACT